MNPIYFATSSDWKYEQAQSYLKQFDIQLERANMELPESRSENVLEIAKEKAEFAFKQLGKPVIVIDGAFQIKGLNDFPKTMVKLAEKYIGARGVLKLLDGESNRGYEWPNALCYKDESTEKLFVGYIRGEIVTELSKDADAANDFGLIQIPTGYSKPFSQMNKEEMKHFMQHVWQPAIFEGFGNWVQESKK